MTGTLNEEVIAITGGAAGIGLAVARAALHAGAKVALIDRDGACAEKAAAELGAAAWGVGADVTDETVITAAVAGAERALGAADRSRQQCRHRRLRIGSRHRGAWSRIMAVNVTGTFLASKAVLSGILERRRGAIVNFGSVAGLVGIPTMAAYCAAKGAVVNLTRQMAADYSGLDICVNVVCPGAVAATDMGRQLPGQDADPELDAYRLAKYPIGRFGTPEDIAEAAVFLLSTKAAFVTGCAFAVDGGMTSI